VNGGRIDAPSSHTTNRACLRTVLAGFGPCISEEHSPSCTTTRPSRRRADRNGVGRSMSKPRGGRRLIFEISATHGADSRCITSANGPWTSSNSRTDRGLEDDRGQAHRTNGQARLRVGLPIPKQPDSSITTQLRAHRSGAGEIDHAARSRNDRGIDTPFGLYATSAVFYGAPSRRSGSGATDHGWWRSVAFGYHCARSGTKAEMPVERLNR